MRDDKFWPRGFEELAADPVPPSLINEAMPAENVGVLVPGQQRSLHVMVAQNLADTESLIARLELGVAVAELARWVAVIFANSASIEHYLSLMLVRILGADAAPALAMFDTLIAQHLQTGALKAAAGAALPEQEYRVLIAALKVAERVQTPRIHLAHWIWGVCDQLPNALCLPEPKAQKNRDRELALALEKSEAGVLRLSVVVPSWVLFEIDIGPALLARTQHLLDRLHKWQF